MVAIRVAAAGTRLMPTHAFVRRARGTLVLGVGPVKLPRSTFNLGLLAHLTAGLAGDVLVG